MFSEWLTVILLSDLCQLEHINPIRAISVIDYIKHLQLYFSKLAMFHYRNKKVPTSTKIVKHHKLIKQT